jgi:hypothetical protein
MSASASSPANTHGNHPWLCNWAQLPHQKDALLSVEDTKDKLRQICGSIDADAV